MSPTPTSNNPSDPRVEVDLKILQDASIDRLEKFGQEFSKSANTLGDLLKSYGDRVAGASTGGSGAAGQPGTNASIAGVTASGIYIPGSANIQNLSGPTAPNPAGVSDNASVASTTPGSPASQGWLAKAKSQSSAGPYISEFQRSQFRLGNFPSYGAAQALMIGSWLTGSMGWQTAPRQNADGSEFNPVVNDAAGYAAGQYQQDPDGTWHVQSGGAPGALGRQASTWFGTAAQVRLQTPHFFNATVGQAQDMVQKMSGNAWATQGQQAGFSRTGVAGSPLGSPAFFAGLNQKVQALWESGFGFNPNYSTQQAQEAQSTIASSGYYGSDAIWLANKMRSLQQNNLMDPSTVMSLMDPVMRFGGEDRDQLYQAIAQLGPDAQAAHIGLQQFTQSLTSAATSVNQQSGAGVGYTATALSGLSATTRMDPSALASGMMSNQNLIMGAALTGQQIGNVVMRGQGMDTAAMALPMKMAEGIMGMSFSQFQSLNKTSPAQATQVLNRLTYAYMSNPQIFGGMSPTQLFNLMAKGVDPGKRAQSITDIQNGTGLAAGKSGFEKIISEFGGSGASTLRKDFGTEWSQVTQGKQTTQQAQKFLENKMLKMAGQQNNAAAQKVTLILDPDAKRLLSFLKVDTSSKNNSEPWWRSAMSKVGGVAELAIPLVTPGGIAQEAGSLLGGL